jgi:hypothetical protein
LFYIEVKRGLSPEGKVIDCGCFENRMLRRLLGLKSLFTGFLSRSLKRPGECPTLRNFKAPNVYIGSKREDTA